MMGVMRFERLVLAGIATFALGCEASHGDGLPDPVTEMIPEGGLAAYPEPPYGVKVGSIIDNFQFNGYADPSVDTSTLVPISLGDFYNPSGNEVYDSGSPFGAGEPKPRVLLIDVSSSWCGPCKIEADEVLPGKYAALAPKGVEFLLQLADGPTPGTAATEADLRAWTNAFDVNYPSAIDPSYQLGALFDTSAYPANFIIRTDTMEIVEVVTGAPEDSFWVKLEATADSLN